MPGSTLKSSHVPLSYKQQQLFLVCEVTNNFGIENGGVKAFVSVGGTTKYFCLIVSRHITSIT